MYHATTTLANILQLVQVGSTGKATRFKNYAGATDSILITNGRVSTFVTIIDALLTSLLGERIHIYRFLHVLWETNHPWRLVLRKNEVSNADD